MIENHIFTSYWCQITHWSLDVNGKAFQDLLILNTNPTKKKIIMSVHYLKFIRPHQLENSLLTTSAAESSGSCKMIGRLLIKPISPFAMSGVISKEIFRIFPNLGLIGGIGGIMFTNSTVSNYNKQIFKTQ